VVIGKRQLRVIAKVAAVMSTAGRWGAVKTVDSLQRYGHMVHNSVIIFRWRASQHGAKKLCIQVCVNKMDCYRGHKEGVELYQALPLGAGLTKLP